MHQYVILANPGHNRIYFDAALTIAQSELTAILTSVNMDIVEFHEDDLGLPACISFSTKKPIDDQSLRALVASSIFYALFEVTDAQLLKPIKAPNIYTFPTSMSQILKYVGKTNEQFTRMMINLAVSACNTNSTTLRLFDPMCGKGTTLYEGFVRGFHVEGIEINKKWAQEIQTYVVQFLKKGRYKHKVVKEKRNGKDGKKLADCFSVETAVEKNAYQAGDVQNFKLFPADTRFANYLVKKNSCDIIVSDLPYGVQHGNKQTNDPKMDRSALQLLKEAVPAWKSCLKTKGAMVLSFNEFTMKRADVAEVLSDVGFTVLNDAPYINYVHRVDQSINRNLIVAVK
ncbi:TRM11 family SAM-dependent methyltransferase [Thalassotalea fusca]